METDSATSSGDIVTLSGHGGNPPGHGPFITLHLAVRNGLVERASYETYVCPGAHACAKALCEMVTKKSLDDARSIRHEHLVERVGPLPPHRIHCYGLALLALAAILSNPAEPVKEEPGS